MLRLVCVNADNYLDRGVEYVNNLFDMCLRNISDKVSFDFTCFTNTEDDGYTPGIKTRKIPLELKGWWNKLYLFQDGVFNKGDRVIYFDLDTIICGGLDDILKYEGPFAILRDFYRPDGFQSSIMSWTPTEHTAHIWNTFEMSGFPDVLGGDQVWIEQHVKPDLWQDILPGQFVSYKIHCQVFFPKGARVIIFHGEPRPHEVAEGFVPHLWKIGGGTTLELESVCNTVPSELERNILNACSLPYPWLDAHDLHEKAAVIVGGGPSLGDFIEDIKVAQLAGAVIFAVNNVVGKLISHGIVPDYHLMGDARPDNADFVPLEHWDDIKCIYSSQCAPEVFSAAKAHNVTIFHPFIPGIVDILGDKPYALVGGGSTTGLQTLAIAYIMGYRKLHIYGFDSSYRAGEGHAYPQKLNDGETLIEVQVNGKKFLTAPWMAKQVEEFRETAANLVEAGCLIRINGSGLLPYVAKLMEKK